MHTRPPHIRRRCILVLAGLSISLAACLEPTLPLPPPDAPDNIALHDSADGVWLVRGNCTPGALVLIKNLDTGRVFGIEDTDADGSYLVQLDATACDEAVVFEIVGSTTSPSNYFIVEPTDNGVPASDACSP